MDWENEHIAHHPFLREMYEDEYFPDELVDKCTAVLLDLCQRLERQPPDSEEALLDMTHTAIESFNRLQEEFEEQDSEFETTAREAIAADFDFIMKAYGYENMQVEEVMAPRNW